MGPLTAPGKLWNWLKTLAIAAILALFIRENLLAFYVVDGNSMSPTLVNGQLVAVNKLVYKFHPPRRGDVVVFVTRGNAFGPGPERVFIKRVIAVPGDTVAIANGAVFLNGEPLHEEYIDTAVHGEMEPVAVDDGMVFLMGDNRRPGGSWDSREYGPVPMTSVLGRAELILFPIPGKVD